LRITALVFRSSVPSKAMLPSSGPARYVNVRCGDKLLIVCVWSDALLICVTRIQFFGSLPVLKHGDVEIAQSIALSQYAADLALGAKTPAQRAKDTMILGAHADIQVAMYKCLFGDEESKAKGQAELDANTEKFLAGIERHLPASGFLHGEEKPSIGDLAIFDFVTSKFPGLKALGRDLAAFPKINALVAAVQAYPGLSAYLGARGF